MDSYLCLCFKSVEITKIKYEEIQDRIPKEQKNNNKQTNFYRLSDGIMQRHTTSSIIGVSILMILSRIVIRINCNIYVYSSREILVLLCTPLNGLVRNFYIETVNRKLSIMRKFNSRTCLTCQ